MLIYNVTVKVNLDIEQKWLQWMCDLHFTNMMQTGLVKDCRMLRLLNMDEADGATYAAQYSFADRQAYELYIEKFAAEMRSEVADKWGNKVVAFRSLMEVVH